MVPSKADKECSDCVTELLEVVEVCEARNELIDSLNKLSHNLQRYRKAELSPPDSQEVRVVHQGECLLEVEESATTLKSRCEEFIGELEFQREEINSLCLQLLDCLTAPNTTCSFDSVRVILAARSLMAAWRLQSQRDEQVVHEIKSFVSNLYSECEFLPATRGVHERRVEANSIDDRITTWADCLGNIILLKRTEWLETLKQVQCLQYNEVKPGDVDATPAHPPSVQTDYNASSNANVPQSRRHCLVETEHVMDSVHLFLNCQASSESTFTFLLLVGPVGSGKTFLCDTIEREARDRVDDENSVQVIRPSLPTDLMGASLGQAEDDLISMFDFARRHRRSVILLDGLDHLIGSANYSSSMVSNITSAAHGEGPQHRQARLQTLFLSCIDAMRSSASDSSAPQHLLIIGAAKDNIDESLGRVDKAFFLQPPNDQERRAMIAACFGLETTDSPDMLSLLTDVTECTVGRSRSELTQYCRQAVASCSSEFEYKAGNVRPKLDQKMLLLAMKGALQSLAPESLRTGLMADAVDMAVVTARDLVSRSSRDQLEMPLFGRDAELVWKELEALVIMPLCQADALDEMLYGVSGTGNKIVCGGVLLTGDSGCGKSAIAFHCARVAANLLPSVTLIDVSCTSLVHKEVGGSERAVCQLFASARAAAPCILLLDGIENIAAVRGNDNTTEGTMDRILSTVLTELDGVDNEIGRSEVAGKIAVIGITHNEQWIDPALRRPGRLERVLRLHKPDNDARLHIVLRELRKIVPSNNVDHKGTVNDNELARFVASHTDGMSGAEVVALCLAARMIGVREQISRKNGLSDCTLTRDHFVAAGLKI